jgi:aminopeptidase N
MKYSFLPLFILIFQLSYSQLLDGNNGQFTQADTLRGALRPERTCYDVKAYDLKLDIMFESKSIAGSNTMTFLTLEDFDRLQIDLFENMLIDKILWNTQELKYTRIFNAVFVQFPEKIQKNTTQSIAIFYHGKPIEAKNAPWDGGFSWKKDNQDIDWLGVSCEGIGASLWWPNKDHLSDEPEQMTVTCTVPKSLKFVGNGKLIKDEVKDAFRTMTWQTSYPINNYNVTLNIGNYVSFQDEYISDTDSSKLILDYWVLPSNLSKAKIHFEQVKPMLKAYEHYFGKFPFWNDNYKLVETPYLGMEHQTAIAYGNQYKKGYNGYDFSRIGLDFDYIIIHESGHEYWGNLISAADVADLWIHEGFCTYSESLYVEYLFGYAKALEYINAKKPQIDNKKPILGIKDVNVEGDGDMYNKGMLFLNTLRHIINNDKLWFEILKDMTTKTFAYKTTNTEEIINYFNQKTQLNLKPVFMQYLAYPKIPTLYYSLHHNGGNSYDLNYKWLTDVTDFSMPLYLNLGKDEMKLDASTQLKNDYDYEIKKRKSPF